MTPKQIQTWVELELKPLHEAVDKIKRKSRIWQILAGVVLVLAIVLLIALFRKQKDDSRIDAHGREIEALKRNNQLLDSLIRHKDEQLSTNRKEQSKVKTRYEQIPDRVTDLTKEQLRREVTDY